MKKNRNVVDGFFEKTVVSLVGDKKAKEEVMKECFSRYKIPFNRVQTIINFDCAVREISDIEIFWMLDVISDVSGKNIDLSDYFTDIELNEYSKMKYVAETVTFPIVLPMNKISDEQWMGVIKATTLIAWRGSILRYNKNIQRRLNTKVTKNTTYETISLNSKSVEEMTELFLEGRYIPDVITINLDDSVEYYYDEEKSVLTISNAEHLDLTDGYHRLVAISKAKERNPQFEYMMGICITNFSDDKANQFIYQKEQQTIMPKRSIDSYNMMDVGNKITKRVNENSSCNLAGNIVRGGPIDFSVFAGMLSRCFLFDLSDEEKKIALVSLPKVIIKALNILTEYDVDLLTKKLTQLEIRALVFCCWKYSKDKNESYLTSNYELLFNREYSQRERKTLSIGKEKKVIDMFSAICNSGGDGDV